MKKNKRAAVVFMGLLGVLAGTSALLLVMQPAPLKPDVGAMMAISDNGPDASNLFNTPTPLQQGRWQYIYIRHSRTPRTPDERGIGDHFILTSAGTLLPTARWNSQSSATPPAGATSIHPKCISIVLSGDFDKTLPNTNQMELATKLVHTLQTRLQIPADRVLLVEQKSSPAGVGKYFPLAAFRENLLK